jgi:anti-anti-sigma factor
MKVTTSVQDKITTLKLEGRFDFAAHHDFGDATKAALGNSAINEIQIDLGNVEYMDSAALGMLLVLLERAKAAGKSISLARVKGMVKQVLEIANFQKLFTIR